MTPAQVLTAARRRYNAETSTFWSDSELLEILYEAEQELALDCLVIEGAANTSLSTAIGTRAYTRPSGVIAIKRIEYNGQKLMPIDFRYDDLMTFFNSANTTQGTPQYYAEWGEQIFLRPLPDAVKTLTIYPYSEATLLSSTGSTLTTPTRCHTSLVNYVAALIASKDENFDMFDRFMARWEADKKRHLAMTRKRKRTDSFAAVKDEETQPITLIGPI